VGLYARVSTERQQERGTVGSQLEGVARGGLIGMR
jgi:DNA invertase Pin-like site-specific DNA recombinase